MDNDLMARRLRPPSEPMQPLEPVSHTVPDFAPDFSPDFASDVSPSAQPKQALPQWPPAPASPTPMAPPPVTPEQVAEVQDPVSLSRAPEAREEVPWDRPDDYDQQTDTAVGDDQSAWDKPADEGLVEPNPAWLQVASVVGLPQGLETADPDDAYAPVLGDVAPTMSRSWPETNGHDAERNAATVGQSGYAETPGYAESPTPVEGAAVAQPAGDATLSAWLVPSSPSPQPVAPESGPTEWPMPAQPTDYAEHHAGPAHAPEQFDAAVALETTSPVEAVQAPAPSPTTVPEQADDQAWLNETAAWPLEPPAPDLPPAVDPPQAIAWPSVAEWAPASVDEPQLHVVDTVSPAARATPVVVRIELEIVDGQLRVVNSADHAKDVTPAPLTAADQPTWSHEVAPTAIPAETIASPWASAAATAPQPHPAPQPYGPAQPPMPEPAPTSYAPWAQNAPTMDPLAEIPAQRFVTQPAEQPVQPAHQQPLAPAPVFAPPAPQQPVATAPAYVAPVATAAVAPAMAPATGTMPAAAPVAAQDQNDPSFLSTEPEDVDSASDDEDEVAPKESTTVFTAIVTIGMAILVIVLVLVFFSLMTSLLG